MGSSCPGTHIIWSTCSYACRVEKYRPIELRDIVGNDDTVRRLEVGWQLCRVHLSRAQAIALEGNMPNIILAVCAVQRIALPSARRARLAPAKPPASSVWRARCWAPAQRTASRS